MVARPHAKMSKLRNQVGQRGSDRSFAVTWACQLFGARSPERADRRIPWTKFCSHSIRLGDLCDKNGQAPHP